MIENLGKKAVDKVTRFTGTITSYIQYLTGCHQYGVTPEIGADGKVPDTHYFDVKRLEIVADNVKREDVTEETNPGGPNRDCPKS
jgi:hypothetical protein